ncbi:MAG: hypothetical protein E6J43_10315 [Chloroflexi bacterium]|nr:MAG: hypothetical protein E6J43_10315 [Chloroflexota bacterium]
MANENFITILVTTTGEDLEERFNVHEPLQVVFNRALQAVGGGANRDLFTLEFDDQPLDLQKRIADYAAELNWGDRVELDLVPRPEVI